MPSLTLRGVLARSASLLPWLWPALRRMTPRRVYLFAAIALLAIAATLRLYALGDEIAWLDETVAAQLAAAELTLAEVLDNTRKYNSSPILYPLLLHAVQRFDDGAAAIRIVPAIASILAVAALLLLLPRAGVSRVAAWLAAAMATFSVPAIRHAQDAREYSIDALMAVLLAVGFLQAARGRRPMLLCIALLIAPSIQYGLALLCAAVVLTLTLWQLHRTLAPPRAQARAPRRESWRRAVGAVAAWACLAAGCALSWMVTLGEQRGGITSVGEGYYGPGHLRHLYDGNFGDIAALGEFAAVKVWEFLAHHVSMPVAAFGLAALAAVVCLRIAGRRRLGPIPLLFGAALGVAIAAAALRLYPLGGVRQTMYLAPIAWIAFGHAMHAAVAGMAALPRRAVSAVAAGAVVIIGVSAVAGHHWRARGDANVMLAAMERHVAGATAYVPFRSASVAQFHFKKLDAQFHYGGWCSWRGTEACGQALVADLLRLRQAGAERLWLASFNNDALNDVYQWVAAGTALKVAQSGSFELFDLPDLAAALGNEGAALRALDALHAQGVELRPRFDAFLDYAERRVVYAMAPCQDVPAMGPFMLRVKPASVADLPAPRQRFGVENLDFSFDERGVEVPPACVAVAPLPAYPIERIDAGQHVPGGGYLVWARSFRVYVARIAAAALAQAPPPAIRSTFDVHLRDGRLIYVKERCGQADRRQPFFVRVSPVHAEDLPDRRRADGFDELDFAFSAHGVVDVARCLAVHTLPSYPIAAIETGQRGADGRAGWSGRFPAGS